MLQYMKTLKVEDDSFHLTSDDFENYQKVFSSDYYSQVFSIRAECGSRITLINGRFQNKIFIFKNGTLQVHVLEKR